MKRIGLIVLVLEILIVSGSCRGNRKIDNTQDQKTIKTNTPVEAPKPAPHISSPGEQAYIKSCLTCHQADGSGVPGMYPPLSLADKVKGPPEEIAKVVLFGQKGPVIVNGVTYNQSMPPFRTLSDSTIAVLVNYVRKRWGGSESAISINDIRKIRASGMH
jgi:mono/diheme cytochrome c family protein